MRAGVSTQTQEVAGQGLATPERILCRLGHGSLGHPRRDL
jgi:hypothetical protein